MTSRRLKVARTLASKRLAAHIARVRSFSAFRTSLVFSACCIVAATRTAAAQAPRSTKDRVYSAAQAAQGKDIYLGRCQSCHTAISHTGAPFRTNWDKRPLSELYDYMLEKMPKDSPGTLTPEEYTLVLAYILRMNGMPAGQEDLPSSKSALKAIRIDAPVPKAPNE